MGLDQFGFGRFDAGEQSGLGRVGVHQRRRAQHEVERVQRVDVDHQALGPQSFPPVAVRLERQADVGVDQPHETVTDQTRLLHHHPVQFGTTCRMAHHCADRADESFEIGVALVERDEHLGGQLGEEVVDRGAPQLGLRREVVVDLGLMHSGPTGDLPGGGTLEPVGRELVDGGVEERLPGGGRSGGGRTGGFGERTTGHDADFISRYNIVAVPLHRLTTVTLAVPSVEATSSFLAQFGLHDEGDGVFATRDGGRQVEVVSGARRSLRRLGLGAADGDDVARLAARIRSWDDGVAVDETTGDDPSLRVREPVTGLEIEITVAPPIADGPTPPAVNAPGHTVERVDRPSDAVMDTGPIAVSNLTHLVYGSTDQPATVRFLTEALGFEISDEVPGIIAFTRCGEVHHNLAVQAAPVAFMHHLAFEVDGVDEVVRGGMAMVEADPDRHLWGVGRHAIGSNWFWYLREPGGNFIEYAADIDRISTQADYRPKDWSGHEFLYSFGPSLPAQFMEPADLADLIASS